MGKRKLAATVYVDGVAYGPDDDVPADVAKQIENPAAWADGSGDDVDEMSSPITGGYEDKSVKDLKAEIDRRNDGRSEGDQISKAGNKADLIGALAADDVVNGTPPESSGDDES